MRRSNRPGFWPRSPYFGGDRDLAVLGFRPGRAYKKEKNKGVDF